MLSDGGHLTQRGGPAPLIRGDGSAPLPLHLVRQGGCVHCGAGEAVVVGRGPERVVVLAEVGRVEVGHAGAGVIPAVVLAVAAFVPSNAVAGQGERQCPAGSAVHGAVHRGEELVAGSFCHGGNTSSLELLDQCRPGHARTVEDRSIGIARNPARAQTPPSGRRRWIHGPCQEQDGLDRRRPQVIAGVGLTADAPAADGIGHGPVDHDGRKRALHGVEEDAARWVGNLERRTSQQGEQFGQPGEQDNSVGTGVRSSAVLDERAVAENAVSAGDVLPHLAESGHSMVEFGRVLSCQGTDDDALAQVNAVGANGGDLAALGRELQPRVGHEMVDGRAVGSAFRGRQFGMQEHHGVGECPGYADLPGPPVSYLFLSVVVAKGVGISQAGLNGGKDRGVPEHGRCGGGPGRGQLGQAGVGGDHFCVLGQGQVREHRGSTRRRVELGQRVCGFVVQCGDGFGEVRVAGLDDVAARDLVHPTVSQRCELRGARFCLGPGVLREHRADHCREGKCAGTLEQGPAGELK
ncbi:hypothetical protein PJL18_02736 [Paenarthrobacter nicotinovorans]|nr:hypothetical protein [Paenarthrobacter nicotinovorans]